MRPFNTGRFYDVDGDKFPSVTTILNIIGKDYLQFWYGKLGNEEAEKQLKAAAQRGTDLHKTIESHIKMKKGLFNGNFQAKSPLFDRFLEFEDGVKVEFTMSETTVFSKKHRFAGTLDAVGIENYEKNPVLTIFDWKTSKSLHKENKLQISAYAYALEEMFPEMAGAIEKARVVRFVDPTPENPEPKPEQYVLSRSEIDDNFKVFLSCLEVWKWKNQSKLTKKV